MSSDIRNGNEASGTPGALPRGGSVMSNSEVVLDASAIESDYAEGVELEFQFNALVQDWKDAVGPSSKVAQMVLHPAYLKIIGMGSRALPLLLRELEREPDHWFVALYSISGEDAAAGHDTFAGAVNAWIEWGRSPSNRTRVELKQ